MKLQNYILSAVAILGVGGFLVQRATCGGNSCSQSASATSELSQAQASLINTSNSLSSEIQWVSIEQLPALQKKEPRKVFVDIYTNWCGWCKVMDKKTFKNLNVANYTNENYYAVKFNAEQIQDVNFNGRVYSFQPSGKSGTHELAIELTNGKLSYPTTVFLDENLTTITAIPGYQEVGFFNKVLTYFAENHYKTISWEAYQNGS